MKSIKSFLVGVYAGGVILSFSMISFLCFLGGNAQDLWKPFVYSLTWPVIFLIFLIDIFSIIFQ